MIDHLRVTR